VNFAPLAGSKAINISNTTAPSTRDLFLETLYKNFPKFKDLKTNAPAIHPNLICGTPISISKRELEQIDEFRKCFFEITSSDQWIDNCRDLNAKNLEIAPDYESLLTAFDFHRMNDGQFRLIEVNTNASLLLPFWQLYHSTKTPIPNAFSPERFIDSFQCAYSGFKKSKNKKNLLGNPDSSLQKIFIFDEEPEKEGLFFEFLILKEFFESKNIECEIIGSSNLEQAHLENALVYNRHTNFFLDAEHLKKLRNSYLEHKACVSPHPFAYGTMAQKNRLIDLRKSFETKNSKLAEMVPLASPIKETSFEDIWARRKGLFFKPISSFGSKGVYSGKGISRKKFVEIYEQSYLAQELCPPGRVDISVQGEVQSMKYDLRFYVTPREILLGGARVYQGQATNLRAPGGGLSPLKLSV